MGIRSWTTRPCSQQPRQVANHVCKALVEAFPNIVRLEAEYMDPFHLAMENWNHANLNPTDLSSALSLVSATLVHLTLTSSVPALLISLNSLVSLRHVNTESVWLFGRSHELSD